MTYLYSASKNSFFLKDISSNIPDDVVDVSEEFFKEAQSVLNNTKRLAPDPKTGKPTLVDIELPTVDWDQIRYRRDIMLQKCDWTLGIDTPLSEEEQLAWRKYRQKLRDITKVFTDPNKVVWPMKPASGS